MSQYDFLLDIGKITKGTYKAPALHELRGFALPHGNTSGDFYRRATKDCFALRKKKINSKVRFFKFSICFSLPLESHFI